MRGGHWLARAARAAAIIWAVTVIVAHSDTGVGFPLWMALFAATIVLALWWALGLSIAGARASKEGGSTADAVRAWAPVPVLMLTTFLLLWSNLPLKARLFFGGPALAQSAGWFATLPPGYVYEKRPRVGSFRVREFTQFGDELRFLTSECGLLDNCGLVFSPSGRPPNRGEDSFEHLYGYWWHWHQSW